MFRRNLARCLAAAVFSLSVALTAAAVAADAPKVGDKAPAFELKASDGKTYKLDDFKGKSPVVIAWFPKAFTGGCTKQCTSYAKDGAKLKQLGVAYFTASVDDAETNTRFAKSLGCDYPILSDPDRKTAEAYGVLSAPGGFAKRWTFYIDSEGVIRGIDQQIDTAGAAGETVKMLAELGLTK
jgi:peroxiredoxin Q/BCP